MAAESLFAFKTYKSYLRSRVLGKDNRGSLSRVAAAAGCQRSYLSRVLTSEVHLTPDHAYRICEYWRFTPLERDFFLALVEWERAGDAGYRQHLLNQLKRMRTENEDLSKKTKRPLAAAENASALYAGSWHWSAVHLLTSIERYQTDTTIADRLRLPLALVRQILEQLVATGSVAKNGNRWVYASGEMHIPTGSPFLGLFHQTWRTYAVQNSQTPQNDGMHFTNVQSLSQQDFIRLKQDLAQFIEECTAVAKPSPPEELVVFNFDLFRP